MDIDKRKQLSVRVDEKTHKQMKLYAVNEGITLQDYLMKLIEQDLKNHKQKKELID